ncbi:DinB family protein [Cohnella fermenti]|uniref:Damage-inducible protein DinB n=1 Tax=Cohnella fermenti TaxID=2565925 RepID=A0A4S4BYU5_9BACL|nr:DinB family protein [Cohnella fermenti]THF80341.1 damage-inducible protein DinB [Cohnella fermenti]
MYRTTEDFLQDWSASAAGTLAVFKAITDEKKETAIVEGHNTLNWLAWHLTGTAGAFGLIAGLQIPAAERGAPAPDRIADVAAKYEEIAEAYKTEAKWTDEQMAEEISVFGGKMPRGQFLRKLIDHQTHHRGQMTVLLRQAGLPVPGVLGPTREMQAK